MSLARYRDRNQPVRVRRRPHLEALEDRTLLSSVPQPIPVFVSVNVPFTAAVASFAEPTSVQFAPPNSVQYAPPEGDFSGSATPVSGTMITEQASVNWGDGTTSPALIESTGNGQFVAVGSHIYTAAGFYTTSTMVTLPGQSTIVVTGVIEVFDVVTQSRGFGGGGFGGTPTSSPPASGSPGTPSSPPGNNNDHGSPAVSFQAILFSPAANTPIGPPASTPVMRTGYFYPPVNAAAANRSPSFRTQESGTREEQPEAVDVILKQLQADFVSAPLDFLMAPERTAPAPKAVAKISESSLPADPFPEDSVPALVCLHSNSDLLSAGLPDDELERVTALALAGFTPVLIAPVAEALVQSEKQESDEDNKAANRSALAVEALVLVVCLCMWPHRPRQEATFVID